MQEKTANSFEPRLSAEPCSQAPILRSTTRPTEVVDRMNRIYRIQQETRRIQFCAFCSFCRRKPSAVPPANIDYLATPFASPCRTSYKGCRQNEQNLQDSAGNKANP